RRLCRTCLAEILVILLERRDPGLAHGLVHRLGFAIVLVPDLVAAWMGGNPADFLRGLANAEEQIPGGTFITDFRTVIRHAHRAHLQHVRVIQRRRGTHDAEGTDGKCKGEMLVHVALLSAGHAWFDSTPRRGFPRADEGALVLRPCRPPADRHVGGWPLGAGAAPVQAPRRASSLSKLPVQPP